MSELQPVAPVEGAPGLVVVRGTFVHWTAPEKMRWIERPKRDEWYECEERVAVCGVGPSGTPSCTLPLPVAFTTYCRDGADPTKPLRGMPRTAADFRFCLTITRGRMTFAGRPTRRETPLPGWYVNALNGERLRDWARTLPPETLPFVLK